MRCLTAITRVRRHMRARWPWHLYGGLGRDVRVRVIACARAFVCLTGGKRTSDTFYRGPGGFIISGGNFHGEYPAKALDFLAIGVHEIANISERRIERLVNPHLSGLPAFLVASGGLNSGFMIAHCTAAACVSENKVRQKERGREGDGRERERESTASVPMLCDANGPHGASVPT